MRAAIYLRQSLDRDLNKVSIDYQRQSLLKLCADKGWRDPVEYMDRNVSATKGRREAYEDLCDDIRNGAVGRVAVWDMDRLHRQPRELEDFIELAEAHQVELANVGGEVDLSTPSGRMFARVKGTVAKYEVEQKGARQKAANRERAKNGKPWVGRPFGYTHRVDREKAITKAKAKVAAEGREWTEADEAAAWNPATDAVANQLVPAEAHEIRQACSALLDGTSLWAIAKDWNARGIKTVKGSTWTGGTVKQVLTRPRNAGLQVYQGEIIEGVETAWPAIVTRDTWEAVCAYLSNPDRHTGKKRARVHLLSGIAVCGLCQRKMGTTARKTKRGEKRITYTCKNTGCMRVVRDKNKTDALVVTAVTTLLARPDASVIFARPTVDTKALSVQAEEYRVLITSAERDYDEGLIDGKRLKGRLEAIQPKLEAVEAQLLGANATRKLDGLLGQPDAEKRFLALDLDRQRAVINAVAVVTIKPASKPGGRFDPTEIDVQFGPQDE